MRLSLASPKAMVPFVCLHLLCLTTIFLSELLDCQKYNERQNGLLGSRRAGHQGSKFDSNGGWCPA
jgi:hypothetical protein